MHSHRQNQIASQTYKIITQYGDMLVVKQGIQHPHHHHHQHHQQQQQATNNSTNQQEQPQASQQTRPVIMTFHDLGLNSELQFARFCECDEVKLMLQTFTMIHVNFVGQELDPQSGQAAETLPADFKYPNVEQMAEAIVDICTQLRVRSFIALAVGAGAHVVASLALMRPDLIDGLFLINPVVTSCSITEWLYFKMSAIASNHHIGGGGGGGGSSSSEHSASVQDAEGGGSPKKHSNLGIRRLLTAAHIHLPHQQPNAAAEGEQQRQQENDSSAAEPANQADLSSATISASSPAQGSVKPAQQSSSRLRRLILSRNFRFGGSGQHQAQPNQQQQQISRTSSTSSSSTIDSQKKSHSEEQATGGGGAETSSEQATAKLNDSRDSINSQSRSSGQRPPLEYLMYHHFGPASFQRYRRSSDTPLHIPKGSSSELGTPGSKRSTQELSSTGAESGSSGSKDIAQSSPTVNWRQRRVAQRTCSRSSDSLASSSATANQSGSRARSGSVTLSASQLASFSNERQRAAYMQSVYKHYFCQLNAHNLWLLAQSFAKRKTLNLRKDCGAAAHAAAAAAALGTSICTAFVGIGPGTAACSGPQAAPGGQQQQQQPNQNRNRNEPAAGPTTEPNATNQRALRQQESRDCAEPGAGKSGGGGGQALVAGTKVKRTFTCQTLIMCSTVQMHCERAFKLMSLLNPLQATWIKTEQLLVLDERPEKVCQALRLFLQGIGYSMSTYERRLRLSSATGSASSADSNGSGRSTYAT